MARSRRQNHWRVVGLMSRDYLIAIVPISVCLAVGYWLVHC